MTSVLIVDDHPVVLQGCRRILEDAGITTVIEARDTAAGYELFRNHRPDVGVIDLSMRDDGLGGMSLIRRIKADNRRFPIVVLSMHRDPTIVLQALEAGALGYVLKDTATEDLLKAVAEVQRGGRYLSHSLAIEVAVARVPPRLRSLADLTPRELDALTLLAKGETYSHIAEELHISYKTVVNISVQLKKKLDVNTLPALVRRAVQLLSPTDVSDSRLQWRPFAKTSRVVSGTISTFARAYSVQQLL
jgi:two-component system, NarL family, invasion response regulator UvrY